MASRRAATFTVSPIAVYSMRVSEPKLPTTASPVCTPMASRMVMPKLRCQSSLPASIQLCMSSAAARARAA